MPPSDANSGGSSHSAGLTDELKSALYKDQNRKNAEITTGTTGERIIEADTAKTCLEYARRIRGLSIEAVAKKSKMPVTTIQRIESGGGVASLFGSEKAGLARVFHRSAEDLARELTDDTKISMLHGTPMPPKAGSK
jgi:hypothetical protein